jgi:hypothetical protein
MGFSIMSWLGCVEVFFISCGSVTVRLCDAIEASSLRSQVRYLLARLVNA